MKVILFGATGMVGQGVLRECLLDEGVEQVLAVGRSGTGQRHEKLREHVQEDLWALPALEGVLQGYDACFFCLGVSSAGMKEAAYRRITYELTLTLARALAERNPGMTFIYVSGEGTDSTERGRMMWARVKGETENALLRLPFQAKYMFRPGFIQPMHGEKTKVAWYRVIYSGLKPFQGVLKALLPKHVTSTEEVGRAMLRAARQGAPKAVLENEDIHRLAAQP
ncbi:NAD-dependent epimerase/dehydratase family protein [Stigmatella aurantiaca]|nr:NAD-dependent epimerase/dehydratase family protein [Stigmatella aurantiaca]